jgi:hypothetical protein
MALNITPLVSLYLVSCAFSVILTIFITFIKTLGGLLSGGFAKIECVTPLVLCFEKM